jgi:peptidyl-dipeptidase A
MEDLVTIHHEMGHIEYYLQYQNQSNCFREGANPGFHEAIGDLMALSVSTPGHLKKIGLLKEIVDDNEATINYQMQIALEKLEFLPFGYLMDLWRWDVFSGKANSSALNRRWWELRLKYQGISPPVKRNEVDFDAGAKYHIPANVEYIRYFVSTILQFSFHEALCKIAQPNVPLHKCDIDGNVSAGKKFGKMLSFGSSVPWPEQLEFITGNRNMTAEAFLEYFAPLKKYLDEQLKNEKIGWNADSKFETKSS